MYSVFKFLGWFIVFFYVVSLMTFILKRIKYKGLKYLKIKGFFIKNHWYFGLIGLSLALIHGIYMYFFVYPNLLGIITLFVFLTTGIFGYLIKKGKRKLIKYHRFISLSLIILIIGHIVTN